MLVLLTERYFKLNKKQDIVGQWFSNVGPQTMSKGSAKAYHRTVVFNLGSVDYIQDFQEDLHLYSKYFYGSTKLKKTVVEQ